MPQAVPIAGTAASAQSVNSSAMRCSAGQVSLRQCAPAMTRFRAMLAHLHGQVWTKSGASWEGFALEQILRSAQPDEAYFWATHAGAELDLLMFRYGRRVGVEFKRMDAPRLTPSMRTAMTDLKLDALYVVYAGDRRYGLADRIYAVPLSQFVRNP